VFDTASGAFGPREGSGRYGPSEQVSAIARSLIVLQQLPAVS
jgi:hypothetical protein